MSCLLVVFVLRLRHWGLVLRVLVVLGFGELFLIIGTAWVLFTWVVTCVICVLDCFLLLRVGFY